MRGKRRPPTPFQLNLRTAHMLPSHIKQAAMHICNMLFNAHVLVNTLFSLLDILFLCCAP